MILFIYIFNFLSMVFGVGVGWTTDYLLSVTVYHYYLLFILLLYAYQLDLEKYLQLIQLMSVGDLFG